jgi:transcription termination factor Rho
MALERWLDALAWLLLIVHASTVLGEVQDSFSFTRNQEAIAEAALDGIYVLRTTLPNDTLAEGDVVAR